MIVRPVPLLVTGRSSIISVSKTARKLPEAPNLSRPIDKEKKEHNAENRPDVLRSEARFGQKRPCSGYYSTVLRSHKHQHALNLSCRLQFVN